MSSFSRTFQGTDEVLYKHRGKEPPCAKDKKQPIAPAHAANDQKMRKVLKL